MDNKPTIYMDMDGVIADFVKGYKQAFNRNAYEDDAFTVNNFCQQIPNFFAMLPVNDKGMELFNHLKNDYNIVFLTTPMDRMEYCKIDKIDWIRENLGEYNVIFSDNKTEFVVDSESVLIDDMGYNLDPWKEAGGTAIKFPQKIDKILHIIEETFNPTQEISRIKSQLRNMVVNTDPSEAQKESGIYKKGKILFKGLRISIENIPGSIRWGFDEDGKKWINRINFFYGYILGTEGNDGDAIDVFINPKGINKSLVFVVNQNKADGTFDEIKCLLGFSDIDSAKKGYLSNYQRGWESRIGSIVQTNTKKLRDWLVNGNLNEEY